MLYLTRKKGQSVLLKIPGYEDVVITISKVDRAGGVQMGFMAEESIEIIRDDVKKSKPEK